MATWYGWIRPRKGASWERVCQAPTLEECSRRLGRIARERGVRDRDSCMTSGAAPPDRRRHRRAGGKGVEGHRLK
jgi:hypothetical protein